MTGDRLGVFGLDQRQRSSVSGQHSIPTKVAKKRTSKRGRLKAVLFFIFTPILIWFLAFLVWFNWDRITQLSARGSAVPASSKPAKKIERSGSPAREKILEEDRHKLYDILKKRQ
jgi:hypothetical protein